MNISQLSTEQSDALTKRTNSYNQSSGENLSNQQYADRIILSQINQWVNEDYRAAVKRLGDAAAALTYEQRMALISQVESQIGG